MLAKLETSVAWSALRESGRTGGVASLAFSLVYTQAFALEQLMLSAMLLSPFLLFGLVADPSREHASKLLSTPVCLMCVFMKAFLAVFHTEDLLLGFRCRAIVLVRYDICRIECRHNVLRK